MEHMFFTVSPEYAGTRLDRFLSVLLPGFSRSTLKKAVEAGACTVDDLPAPNAAVKLKTGQRIAFIPPAAQTALIPEEGDIDVLYEDEHLAVINKPAGITVHPCPSCPEGTLVHRLLARFPALREQEGLRPGIVHRLDKDTSGLLVIALTETSRLRLSEIFADRGVHKEYLALVHGVPPLTGGSREPVGRHPDIKVKMAVVPENKGGKAARSEWRVLWSAPDGSGSLLAVRIFTGRTHQIRVHLSHAGYPLLGDSLYGGTAAAPPESRGTPAKRIEAVTGFSVSAPPENREDPASAGPARETAQQPAALHKTTPNVTSDTPAYAGAAQTAALSAHGVTQQNGPAVSEAGSSISEFGSSVSEAGQAGQRGSSATGAGKPGSPSRRDSFPPEIMPALPTRQMLHAWHITFPHPVTGDLMDFRCPPPRDMPEAALGLCDYPQRIVITGNPGCGKSSLTQRLAALGLPAFSADAVVKKLYSKKAAGWDFLRHRFGSRFFDENGEIDRRALFSAMTLSPALRREIEVYIHALVRDDLEKFWRDTAHSGSPSVAEIPLFFEAGWGVANSCRGSVPNPVGALPRIPSGLCPEPRRGSAPDPAGGTESLRTSPSRFPEAASQFPGNGGNSDIISVPRQGRPQTGITPVPPPCSTPDTTALLRPFIVVVSCPQSIRYARLLLNRGWSEETSSIMESWQWPEFRKKQAGDYLIDNSGPEVQLDVQATTLLARLADLRRQALRTLANHLTSLWNL